jgi:hypothetical protein
LMPPRPTARACAPNRNRHCRSFRCGLISVSAPANRSVAGASVDTVGRGAGELEAGISPDDRVRAVGAGRRSVEAVDPELVAAVEALVAPESRGDPQSPLRWTTKSTARLAEELTTRGHPVAARTVARLLTQAGYSLGLELHDHGQKHARRDTPEWTELIVARALGGSAP